MMTTTTTMTTTYGIIEPNKTDIEERLRSCQNEVQEGDEQQCWPTQ